MYIEQYQKWLTHEKLLPEFKEELEVIAEQKAEIEDRFYKNLEFGTGGIRGIIGAGTNRMNTYTVRKATLGLAQFIVKQGQSAMKQGVVIAYDSRRFSTEFAKEAARILAMNQIKVYLFDSLRPTPVLSYAVRHLKAYSGIVITASHNPPEYNGYKVYNEDGNQITEEMAAAVLSEIASIECILDLDVESFEHLHSTQMIEIIGTEIDQAYDQLVIGLLQNQELILEKGANLNIVYTPLHGTGYEPVQRILKQVGFTHLAIVEEQKNPDPNFSTVKAPNPEERDVYELAISLAEKVHGDIIMANDPDADRLGVLVKTEKGYEALNGNQLGALLLYYLLDQRKAKGNLPANGALIKTIVTSDLGNRIAEKYQIITENTLTGFKYIGERIKEYEETNAHTFLFGYEESYGYLAGDFVRDKDAVQITVLVAEMALYYKQQGKTLFDLLESIYQEIGYYQEDLKSITLKGIDGANKINEIVALFREKQPTEIDGIMVAVIEDYLTGIAHDFKEQQERELTLPKSNVIKIILEDHSWIAIRPSGTEPKLKFYFSANDQSKGEVKQKIEHLKAAVMKLANISG